LTVARREGKGKEQEKKRRTRRSWRSYSCCWRGRRCGESFDIRAEHWQECGDADGEWLGGNRPARELAKGVVLLLPRVHLQEVGLLRGHSGAQL